MCSSDVLITGGTGVFGKVIIESLLRDGCRVFFTGTSSASVLATLKELALSNVYLQGYAVDLAQEEGIAALVEELGRKSFMPQVLINGARSLSSLRIDPVEKTSSRQDFLSEYLLQVVVPYELTIALSQRYSDTLSKVINIGSIYGSVCPNPYLYSNSDLASPIQYGVAKAALQHLTKELAVRLISLGVTVNCIAFGGKEGRVSDDFKNAYSTLCPSGRMLTDEEIAGSVKLLIFGNTSAMTGQTLMADGGWTLW